MAKNENAERALPPKRDLGRRNFPAALGAMLLVTACAAGSKRLPYETESTLGRVVGISGGYQTPGVSGDSGVPVMAAGAVVVVRNQSNLKSMTGYQIASTEGQVLVTYSEGRFQPGDCVRLWHPPLAPFSDNPKYNVVAGTLVAASECPKH